MFSLILLTKLTTMKKFISLSMMLIAFGFFMNSCSKNGITPTGPAMKAPPPPPPPAPNPVIAFITQATHKTHGVLVGYSRIMVMNADGTAQFSVFDGAGGGIPGGATIWSPSWSPDGKHISFVYDDGSRFTVAGENYIARSVWTVDVNVTSTTVT